MIVRITEGNLCDASIVYSKAWHNSIVSLIVMNVNLRARAFYEKCGFIYDSEIKVLSREKQISELKYIFKKQ